MSQLARCASVGGGSTSQPPPSAHVANCEPGGGGSRRAARRDRCKGWPARRSHRCTAAAAAGRSAAATACRKRCMASTSPATAAALMGDSPNWSGASARAPASSRVTASVVSDCLAATCSGVRPCASAACTSCGETRRMSTSTGWICAEMPSISSWRYSVRCLFSPDQPTRREISPATAVCSPPSSMCTTLMPSTVRLISRRPFSEESALLSGPRSARTAASSRMWMFGSTPPSDGGGPA